MELLTIKDYARRSRLPISAIRKMVKDKYIPSKKIGVAWRIDALAADEIIRKDMAKSMEKLVVNTPAPVRTKSGNFLSRLKAL